MCWHELLLEVKPQISSVEAQTQRKVSVKRGLRCTRETAIEYIDDLAAHLIEVDIAPYLVKQEPGVWKGDIDLSQIWAPRISSITVQPYSQRIYWPRLFSLDQV